jgi:hypothetical protein
MPSAPVVRYTRLRHVKPRLGQANLDARIAEIDIRRHRSGYSFLNTLIHEFLHIEHPTWSETHVRRVAGRLSRYLWREKIRPVA